MPRLKSATLAALASQGTPAVIPSSSEDILASTDDVLIVTSNAIGQNSSVQPSPRIVTVVAPSSASQLPTCAPLASPNQLPVTDSATPTPATSNALSQLQSTRRLAKSS